jgi:hypothetical protein
VKYPIVSQCGWNFLADGKTSVGDVAARIMYETADLAFDTLCDCLAAVGSSQAISILDQFMRDKPTQMMAVRLRWSTFGSEDQKQIAVRLWSAAYASPAQSVDP